MSRTQPEWYTEKQILRAIYLKDKKGVPLSVTASNMGRLPRSLQVVVAHYRAGEWMGSHDKWKQEIYQMIKRLKLGQGVCEIARARGSTSRSIRGRLDNAGVDKDLRAQILEKAEQRRRVYKDLARERRMR